MQKVVIVMPALNERENISKMINQLLKVEFPKIDALMYLLIVDNHSTDGMTEKVLDLSKKYKNLKLIQQKNSGLGWAYVTGFEYAINELGADAVMEMDGDFQHPTGDVVKFVDSFIEGYDYVLGARYIKGGSIPKEWSFPRRAVSYLGNLFIRLVLLNFKLHDFTTNFRLTKVKGLMDQIQLENLMELNRFAFKVDLFYQTYKMAKKIKEIPFHFKDRTMDNSKFNYKEMLSTFKVAIILGIKDKIKIIKFGIVGFTGFIVNYIALRLLRNYGLTETLSWAFSTELAIINNYVFNNAWTFKDQEIKGLKQTIFKFLQFNLTSAGAIVIQSIAGPIGVRLVGVQYDVLVLAFVVLFLVLPYNFTMYNLVIWRKKKS